ncbi:MAG: ABC transporter permease [Sedimentisphaerales bacterium]|nr:ABC transporter permease [Sedimentisphaerales bacterium]
MGTLWQDVRFAGRMLRKSPGFTATALITLAIGIGANTIMFSVVNVLLLRPAQVKDPDRLMGCRSRGFAFIPYSAYVDLRDDNPIFSDLMAHGWDMQFVTLEQADSTRRAYAMFVSANYFATLGIAPARGRSFLVEEERVGAAPVAVLSYRAWQRQGADPNIVGTQVSINGILFHVIGVAPKRFTGTSLFGPDLWLPLGVYRLVTDDNREPRPARAPSDYWDYPSLALVGRLKADLDLSQAKTRLLAVAARLKERFPRRWEGGCDLYLHRPGRLSTYEDNDQGRLSALSLFLMAVSGIVLLIACLNLANMYVVQGASRRREIAIRMAIGGGRMQIIRQLLIESLLLAALGGIGGLVLAFWGTKILNASLAALRLPFEMGAALDAGLDTRVLAATAGFCLIAAVLSGLRPALRLSRRDVVVDLKEAKGGALRPTVRARRLVPRGLSAACQTALSVVLVMGAGLFTHSALTATRMTPGYRLDDKLLIEVEPRRAGRTGSRSLQVCERLVDHLSTLPSVQAVGLSTSMPFGVGIPCNDIHEYKADSNEDRPVSRDTPLSIIHGIGGDYLQAMGLPLLRGRYFSRAEWLTDAPVVVIDEVQARRLRPDGNALGCLISGAGRKPREVVGIVPGVRHGIFEKKMQPHVYVPLTRDFDSFGSPIYIHVRTAGSARGGQTALIANLPQEIRQVDSQVAILSLMTMSDFHRNGPNMWLVRIVAGLAVAFGAMALFLAALGIYAVKGYMVASRTPEIGIRMALGATCGNVLTMVLREGAVLTLVGLLAGMLLALAVARVVASVLCGVNPIDPASIAATLVLLGATSLLAGYIPARRAAKVDPMVALRCE